jgi:hypothetical protein
MACPKKGRFSLFPYRDRPLHHVTHRETLLDITRLVPPPVDLRPAATLRQPQIAPHRAAVRQPRQVSEVIRARWQELPAKNATLF